MAESRFHPLERSSQCLVTLAPNWTDTRATLVQLERGGTERTGARDTEEAWSVLARNPVTIGRTGLAWGRGLHPAPVPEGQPVKREGDGKSPAGAFDLGTAFGYAETAETQWPYLRFEPGMHCVDDPESERYNRIVSESETGGIQWSSSEILAEVGEPYRWGVVVRQNMDPVKPAGGSCVFLHIWEGPDIPTAGCTAMEAARMEALIRWLKPEANPKLIQLPRDEYLRRRPEWNLPGLETLFPSSGG